MDALKNLSEKDKRTLKWGAISAALLLYLMLVLFPLKDGRDSYQTKTADRLKIAEEVTAMSRRYKELTQQMDRLRRSAKKEKGEFTLFSFLDGVAAESGLKKRIKGMKPSVVEKEDYTESTVAVELEDVQIKALTQYIHIVESSGQNVKISKVDIKPRYSDPNKINATLIISAIAMKR